MSWTDISVCYRHPEWPDKSDGAQLLAAMDRCGMAQAWVYGYHAVATHDFERANDDLARADRPAPGRLVPIGLVNPFHAFPAVDRLLDRGFKGIKILTGWGNWLTMDNVRRNVIPIAKRLHERSLHISLALEGNVPVTGGNTFLPYLVRDAVPEACIVLDHCWSPASWEDYLALAQEDHRPVVHAPFVAAVAAHARHPRARHPSHPARELAAGDRPGPRLRAGASAPPGSATRSPQC